MSAKRTTIYCDEGLWKKFYVVAVLRDTSRQDLIQKFIQNEVERQSHLMPEWFAKEEPEREKV